MFILLTGIILVCSAIFVSIEAMKNGMSKKVWFVTGMCLGPFSLPIFTMQRNMALLQSTEVGTVRLNA
jgi:hypothetical protein